MLKVYVSSVKDFMSVVDLLKLFLYIRMTLLYVLQAYLMKLLMHEAMLQYY
jgi:hypothetical protein